MRRLLAASLLLASATGVGADDFFEAKVRPILVDHCLRCHGEKKQQAGLRLDSAAGLVKGSDTGPVVVAGDPAKSKLITAIRRQGEYPMPPDKALPAEAVEVLTEWVKSGAKFPMAVAGKTMVDPAVAGKMHWAFRPPVEPVVPLPKTPAANPIDRFLLAKLEPVGLGFASAADQRTLIRRVYFDLIGLPPTAAEIDAFITDRSPQAFERVVDRLLANPHYGERWARHWLDLARYADSKGYVFQEERTYPYAYTYRDYVIRSFNEDRPFDRFIIEQIAADKLPPGADKRSLAALGFLTLGRRFSNNQQDIIDDRIDVVTRGLMGLTVACARCHDHKYDPIPAADYYSLYGVFASTIEPKDLPLIGEAEHSKERDLFEAELKKREEALTAYRTQRHAEIVLELRSRDVIAKYLLATAQFDGAGKDAVQSSIQNGNLRRPAFDRWREALAKAAKTPSPVLGVWLALAKLPEAGFADAAGKVITDTKGVNPTVREALIAAKPTTLAEAATALAKVLSAAWPPPKGEVTPERSELLAVIGVGGPPDVPFSEVDKLFNRADRDKGTEFQKKIDQFKATSPFAPPRAMAVVDAPSPTNPYVFLRGNPGNHGPSVPRQFVSVLAPDRKPFTDGSGRLGLATAIASPTNPLTARVFVNRVWGYLIGKPLVNTPSDFGVRSEPPTHPELLDWLAIRFVQDGWSVKALQKRILLSAAYQQASVATPAANTADPENRLVGRMNRKRADFEYLWDSWLHTAGKLDETVSGRSINLFARPTPTRRAVYAFIDRQNLPGTLRTFDFPNPEQHTPQRFVTTVPQQALFLMNSPFAAEQAKAVAARPEIIWAMTAEAKVTRLYRVVLGRNPTASEVSLTKEFAATVTASTAGQLGPWEMVAQILLCSNEFAFVD